MKTQKMKIQFHQVNCFHFLVGYNYTLDIIQNKMGRKIQYIKLIPIDSATEIKYALLGIEIKTKHIYNLIEIGKNNTKTTLNVLEFNVNTPIPIHFLSLMPQNTAIIISII